MTDRPAAAPQPRRSWLAALAVFLLALAPRAAAGSFLTVDEAYHWLDRVELFRAALRAGDWAGTNLIGHPGVTTLWLGAAGASLHEWLAGASLVAAGDLDAQRALTRLPLAIVNALCVALALPLLRRLIDSRAALLAALLIAGEPFLVAHAQLLHLDALLTSFMTLSLLAALAGADERPKTKDQTPKTEDVTSVAAPIAYGLPSTGHRAGLWVVSGIFGGLALLTKSPAILLIPMVGLIALLGAWREIGWAPRPRIGALLAPAVGRTALWCAVAAGVWLALWPAAWVDPLGAIGRVALQAEADGGSPHGWGNFFMGRAVADPGPLFYPVAVAYRLAPWTALGLAAGLWLWLANVRRGERRLNLSLALLALFVAGFALALSIPPKKFDRYVLPIYPALDILAAAGLVRLADRLRRGGGGRLLGKGGRAAWLAMAAVIVLNLAFIHPYELAYFTPLLGGGPAAAKVVPVGWGEGYELAGAYISQQYNGADRPTAARYEPVLAPFVPSGAAPLAWWQEPGQVDYAVVYIDQIQREDKPETFHPLLERATPVHTVRINGIEYAYVYQIAPPMPHLLTADFGDALRLVGYGVDATEARENGAFTLTLQWDARQRPAGDYVMFVHVFDERGQRVINIDVPPGDARAPTSSWQEGHRYTLVQPIPLPADLPAGAYRIAIGVYDPATTARLPLKSTAAALPEAGANALLLSELTLP